MKKQIKSAIIFVITAVIMASSQVAAATQTPQHITINVPFDFIVADQKFPAGRYNIRRLTRDTATALFIKSVDGHARAIVLSNATSGGERHATLTFRRYDDQHFLAGVWMPGADVGRELQESKQERGLREQAAAGRTTPKTITLVAER